MKTNGILVRDSKIRQQTLKPRKFTGSSGHRPIFDFSRGPRDSVLFLGFPGDNRVTQEHKPPNEGAVSQRATHPIRITPSLQLEIRRVAKNYSLTRTSFEIFNNSKCSIPMLHTRLLDKL